MSHDYDDNPSPNDGHIHQLADIYKLIRVLLKLKMNGVHEYLLAVQIGLIKLNLVDWQSIYSNSVEYKNLKRGF